MSTRIEALGLSLTPAAFNLLNENSMLLIRLEREEEESIYEVPGEIQSAEIYETPLSQDRKFAFPKSAPGKVKIFQITDKFTQADLKELKRLGSKLRINLINFLPDVEFKGQEFSPLTKVQVQIIVLKCSEGAAAAAAQKVLLTTQKLALKPSWHLRLGVEGESRKTFGFEEESAKLVLSHIDEELNPPALQLFRN